MRQSNILAPAGSLRIPLDLAPGKTRRLTLPFGVGLNGGVYFITTATLAGDVNAADDTATSLNVCDFSPPLAGPPFPTGDF